MIRDGSLTDEGVIDRSADDVEAGNSFAKIAGPCFVEPTVLWESRSQDRGRLARTQSQCQWEPGQHRIRLEHGMPRQRRTKLNQGSTACLVGLVGWIESGDGNAGVARPT